MTPFASLVSLAELDEPVLRPGVSVAKLLKSVTATAVARVVAFLIQLPVAEGFFVAFGNASLAEGSIAFGKTLLSSV